MYKKAKEVLKAIQKHPAVTVQQLKLLVADPDLEETVAYLYRTGHLRIEPYHAILNKLSADSMIAIDTPLVITIAGKISLEEDNRTQNQHIFNEVRAWITLAIALFSLFFSIVT